MITKLTSVVNRIWSKFSMKYGDFSMKKADTLFMSVVKHPVVSGIDLEIKGSNFDSGSSFVILIQ